MLRNTRSMLRAIILGVAAAVATAVSVNAQSPDQLLKDAFAQLNAGTEKKDDTVTAAGLNLLRRFAQEAPANHKMKKPVVAALAWLDRMRETEAQLAAAAEALMADPHRTSGTPSVGGGRPLKFIRPDYPPLPREANAHDKVAVQCEIGEDGKVTRVFSVKGHPLLQQAAAEAALRHQFVPLVVNGSPSKSIATLTFTF